MRPMDGTRAQVTIVDETHPITRENILDEKVTITGRDGESKEVAIGDFATLEESEAPATIAHENSQKTVTITAEVADGHNNALLARELQQKLDGLQLPDGYSGRTRVRPILMTALTTILAMLPLVFSQQIGTSMERGMALVVVGGLAYATLMTLYIVPVLYDLLYRKVPAEVDLGDESVDDDPGDAQAYLEELRSKRAILQE